MGIQTISCIAAGADILGRFPLYNYAYPLTFTAAAPTSRLFGGMGPKVEAAFAQNVTTNWHNYGVGNAPCLRPARDAAGRFAAASSAWA